GGGAKRVDVPVAGDGRAGQRDGRQVGDDRERVLVGSHRARATDDAADGGGGRAGAVVDDAHSTYSSPERVSTIWPASSRARMTRTTAPWASSTALSRTAPSISISSLRFSAARDEM